jgi:hypothetical protein
MARRAAGVEFVELAKTRIQQAKTIHELRMAQAVFLPLEFGLSIEQTAEALGVSRGWACQLRGRFAKIEPGEMAPRRLVADGRARTWFASSRGQSHKSSASQVVFHHCRAYAGSCELAQSSGDLFLDPFNAK